jgi:hypothetical protein
VTLNTPQVVDSLAKARAVLERGFALFQLMAPGDVEIEVERAEGEILEDLRADAPFIRTNIEVLDYLVDQIRFLQAGLGHAERRGLRGLPALQWTAYLSWPQTQRLAETQWRRDLVQRYAFTTPAWLWQRALHAHRPDDPVNVGPFPEGRRHHTQGSLCLSTPEPPW